jgi:hypothetical protein
LQELGHGILFRISSLQCLLIDTLTLPQQQLVRFPTLSDQTGSPWRPAAVVRDEHGWSGSCFMALG